MAGQLSDAKRKEYDEAFSLFDRNEDGKIGREDLGKVMRSLGKAPTQEELRVMVNQLDVTGQGYVNREEFMMVMSQQSRSKETPATITRAFKMISNDEKGTGKMSVQELKQVMQAVGDKLSEAEVEDMIKHAADHTDADGYLDYAAFAAKIMHRPPIIALEPGQ